jgi:hypothetical protein
VKQHVCEVPAKTIEDHVALITVGANNVGRVQGTSEVFKWRRRHLILRAICWWRVPCKLMPQDTRCTVFSISLARIRLCSACVQIWLHPASVCISIYLYILNRCPSFPLNTFLGTNSGFISVFCKIFFVNFRASLDISGQDSNSFSVFFLFHITV